MFVVIYLIIFSIEFYKVMPEKKQNVERIVKTIEEGLELLQFQDDLLQVVGCLLHFNICVAGAPILPSPSTRQK